MTLPPITDHSSLIHDRREHLRRDADRRHDDFLVRFILTVALALIVGVYMGVQMEKRNAQNIDRYRSESSVHSVADFREVK